MNVRCWTFLEGRPGLLDCPMDSARAALEEGGTFASEVSNLPQSSAPFDPYATAGLVS